MSNNPEELSQLDPEQENFEPSPPQAPEDTAQRESVVAQRRRRQSGRKMATHRKLGLGFLALAGLLVVYFFAVDTNNETLNKVKTVVASNIDLEVTTTRQAKPDLDFGLVVPAAEKAELGVVDRLEAVTEQLGIVGGGIKDAGSAISANQDVKDESVKQALDEFNKGMTAEREQMLAEIKKLQDEIVNARSDAQKREEERLREAEQEREAELNRQAAEQQKLEQEAAQAEQEAEELAKEKAANEDTEQRVSKLLILDGNGTSTASIAQATAPASDASADVGSPEGGDEYSGSADENYGGDQYGGAPAPKPSALEKNLSFMNSSTAIEYETATAKSISNPGKTVIQGTIISAVLETAISTELPGSIRAQVTEPVYSYDGTRILMPAGTLVIGSFNPEIALEQKRVLIVWNRAVTPAGKSVALGGTGTDTLGRPGTRGRVDNRYFKKFAAAAVISAVSIAPAILSTQLRKNGFIDSEADTSTDGGEYDDSDYYGGGSEGSDLGSALEQVGGSLSQQAESALQKYLQLGPVLSVPQGEEIRIFVNKDLIFR